MRSTRVPAPLRDRLGDAGSIALLDVLDNAGTELKDEIMIAVADRFERRLAEQMAETCVAIVREIHDRSVDILKWSFIFWIGQMSIQIGIYALLIRGIR